MDKMNFKKIIMISIFLILLVVVIFLLLNYLFFEKEGINLFEGGDWVSIIIGTISAVSTIILGYISYWQNKKQREDNIRTEKQMREQYSKEKETIFLTQKVSVLIEKLNQYCYLLRDLDIKFYEKYFECELLEFTNEIVELTSIADINKEVTKFKRKANEYIVFLNYIYNIIVYNKYYVDELYDCAISLVILRTAIESYSIKYLNFNTKYKLEGKSMINDEELRIDSIELMKKYLDFKAYWTIFIQGALDEYENLIYKNDLDLFKEWFDVNHKKNQLLKEKVAKITSDVQK